jgi:hypothetical protein
MTARTDDCYSNDDPRRRAAIERLREECEGRALGDAARAELKRLLARGTAVEIERVLRDLPPPARPGPGDPETTAAFIAEWEAYERRVEAHRARIEREARRLGAQVAQHRLTLDDAAARLRDLALVTDLEAPIPVLMLPYSEATALLEAAFREGFGAEVAA